MCEQTPFTYQSGEVVWVKLGPCWWPGEARDYDELPDDAKTSLKKIPVTVVHFFNEEKYEYVRNYDQVCLYNCKRKNEFIQKGLDMLKNHKNDNYMDKFPSDVIRAEELTNGNPKILENFQLKSESRPDYNAIFSKSGKSPRKGHSPNKPKRNSLPVKQKVDLNVTLPENGIPLGRHSDSVLCLPTREHSFYIRIQPGSVKDDGNENAVNEVVTMPTFCCFSCGFKTTRLEGFMAHRRGHRFTNYGFVKPGNATPRRSRKKSEGTADKKRSSYSPSASSQSSANKKRTPQSSKSKDAKSEAVKPKPSKADNSKSIASTNKRAQRKKVVLNEPESSEKKSPTKLTGSKKKMSQKSNAGNFVKTQILEDWNVIDDEDDKDGDHNKKDSKPIQQEEKTRKDSMGSCFEFDELGGVMLNEEHEKRADRFARTRNIPIIPKPDSSAKKRRLEELPSTSREVRLSNKRAVEETVKQNKRLKTSADQNEEAYVKLMLGDAVPEYEPPIDSSSTLPDAVNNNIILEEKQKTMKRPNHNVDKELNTLHQIPCPSNIVSSSEVHEENMSRLDAPDECNSESMTHIDEQNNSEITFCDRESLHSRVRDSVAELTEGNRGLDGRTDKDSQLQVDLQDDNVRPLPSNITAKEGTESTKSETAISCILPESLEVVSSSEVKTNKDAIYQRELVATIRENCVDAGAVGEPEYARVSDTTDIAGSVVNVSCDMEEENIVQPGTSDCKQDDEDDDMPEIICVEHRSPQKTIVFHGEERERSEHTRQAPTKEIRENEMKPGDEIDVSSPNELISLEETQSHMSLELSSNRKEADNKMDLSCPNESLAHSKDGLRMRHSCDSISHINKGAEMLEGDNNDEITIIGYRCGINTDFKDLDESMQAKNICASPNSNAASDMPESTRVDANNARPITEFSNTDSALIKVLEGSADDDDDDDDDKLEQDSSTKEEDLFSTKESESSKVEVSREEIVAEWSDEFDDDHDDTPLKEKTIEVIDLDKSESEDAVENEADANLHAGTREIVSGSVQVKDQEKEEVLVLKTVPTADVAKDDEMELDIDSMPVVMEDAVIKDDIDGNYGCMTQSTSRISVVGTSTPMSVHPKGTRAFLFGPATTAVKTLASSMIVVSSQSRQLPQTARGVSTSPRSKVVIMPSAARGKKFAPMLVANSSGIATRVYTESEQECLFKEGKKTLVQRARPKFTIPASKTKPLLPSIQKSGSGIEGAGMKIIQSKSLLLPGTSLMTTSPSGVTALKVDPAEMQNVALQGTLQKIVVHSNTSKIMLPKKLTVVPSGTGPQGLKRLTNIFPLVKGSGTNAKQVVISQSSTKPLKVQASVPSAQVQVFPKTRLQPLKKTKRMFTCQKTSPSLKSIPTTTIEISVSGVQPTQPVVTLAPSVQRGGNVSAIPRIPSSTITVPGTPASTASSLLVGSQDSPSVVVIVNPGNSGDTLPYSAHSDILNYNLSSQNPTSQQVYLESSSISTPGSLDGVVITLASTSNGVATNSMFTLADNQGRSPMLISNSVSGQDILATALANTEVFKPEACLQDTLAVVSNEQSISEVTAMLPTLQSVLPAANPSEVLETLMLKEPIMTPLEVPSCVTSIQVQPPPPVSLHASLAASPSMPLLTDDPVDHVRSPALELYENSVSQDDIVIQANLNEEPQIIGDEGR